MLHKTAFANALAVVSGSLYLVCVFWVMSARDNFMGMMNSWAHGLDVSALPAKTPDFGQILVGLVTFVLVSWLVGYAFGATYNYFAAKK